MPNSYFQFKKFIINQDRCAMKVTTDACLFGAWVAGRIGSCGPGTGSREPGGGSMLDIGTGTGLLSLMIAQQHHADITTVEIDTESFEQASDNITASPWTDRIKVIHADAREFEFPDQYNIIISNPPFYKNELKGSNSKKNIAHHHEGLLLPELLKIIKKNLKPDGTFFLLLPFKRNEEIRKLIIESEVAIRHLTFARHSTKHNFFRIMLEGTFKTNETNETTFDEISIMNDPSSAFSDTYTPAFINLLKDYYLHL